MNEALKATSVTEINKVLAVRKESFCRPPSTLYI